MKRTHTCNQLTLADVDRTATLIGWVESVRDHGGVLFIDLRDREGLTQVVFDPERPDLQQAAHRVKDESVIEISGVVKTRAEGTANPRLKTGEIEVFAHELTVHNMCDTLPFPLDDAKAERVNEDLRLTHRYLDLRRPRSLHLLKTRHRPAKATRDYFDAHDFLEIETPTLFKSTPEGAREFLVPSRLNPGDFYALSQSPQQYKQMLMVAGVERYYAMARCYRDEDLRSDRQPEFTQIDLEMSFIDREDMYALIEGLFRKVWKDVLDVDIPTPFPRMPYQEAMDRYGVDKPDTRFDLEIVDLTAEFKDSEFKVFANAANGGGVVRAFNAKGMADITQGEIKNLEDIAKTLGAKGLAYVKAEAGGWKSPILKFFSEEEKAALQRLLKVEDGDLLFFAATDWETACHILGRVRLEAAQLLVGRKRLTIPDNQYNFLWVVDFPLMLFDAEAGRHLSAHHPFTAPVPEDAGLLESDPLKIRGQHYDVVLNGVELGGGSIRIHQPDLQEKIFKDVLKIPADVVESRFGYMLRAFRYGAPPHGGIAIGFDRMCAILGGTRSIRDVIAFPKTQRGQDLMAGSPAAVTDRQLSDLRIATVELPE